MKVIKHLLGLYIHRQLAFLAVSVFTLLTGKMSKRHMDVVIMRSSLKVRGAHVSWNDLKHMTRSS